MRELSVPELLVVSCCGTTRNLPEERRIDLFNDFGKGNNVKSTKCILLGNLGSYRIL